MTVHPTPEAASPLHPPLADWLDQAQQRHADETDAVRAGLLQRAATLPADTSGAQAIHLAEHVWLAHCGEPRGLGDFLQRLPSALHQAEATAPAVMRVQWSIAQVIGAPGPAPDAALRWRALQNVVLALSAQGRNEAGANLLAADEALAAALGTSDAGRAFAASANNVAQHLADAPGREAGRDALMLQAATVARRAWAHAGTWLHAERAEYRLALCHALLGDGGTALHHARLCLHGCAQGDGQQPADAVEHFFAYEALARAHHSAGDAAAAAAAVAQMAALLPGIDQADGLRAWCAQVLQDLPV